MKKPINFRSVMRSSVRLYFAPLTGAFKGIREEVVRTDQDSKNRNFDVQARESAKHA